MATLKDVIERRAMKAVLRLPRTAQRALFGAPPRNDRGAPLDLQAHVLLRLMDRTDQPEIPDVGVVEGRILYDEATALLDFPPRPIRSVEDYDVGDFPVRAYRPAAGLLPCLVYFHGGGFVVGSVAGYDGLCRFLAIATNSVVVSVDYRRAPEHPFPEPVEDAVTAFRWVRSNAELLGIDPERIAVGGDSAGGNLATVVCQRQINEAKPTPFMQILVYPTTDRTRDYPSEDHFEEGYFLTMPTIRWFSRTYLGPSPNYRDPRVSPIHFERLAEMPPAFIVTAGFDPLRDEGEAYAHALQSTGVQVWQRSEDRLVHGFITMGGVVRRAARAISDLAEDTRIRLHSS